MSEKTAREHLPMSDYEKFLFDLKGFLVIPSVLTEKEIAIARDHIDTYMKTPESLPEHHRSPISGPTEFLIDHPRVMGILQEVIDPDRSASDWKAYSYPAGPLRKPATSGGHTWGEQISIHRFPFAFTTAASTAQ